MLYMDDTLDKEEVLMSWKYKMPLKLSFSWRQIIFSSKVLQCHAQLRMRTMSKQKNCFSSWFSVVLGSKAMTSVIVAYLTLMVSIPIRSTDHWRAASFSFDTGDFWNPPTLWNKPGKVLKSVCHNWFAELEYSNKFQMISGISDDIAKSFSFFSSALSPKFFCYNGLCYLVVVSRKVQMI